MTTTNATTVKPIEFPIWKTVRLNSGRHIDLVVTTPKEIGVLENSPEPELIAKIATDLGLRFVPFAAVLKLVTLLGKNEDDPSLHYFLHCFANEWGEVYSVHRRSEYQERKNPNLINHLIFEGRWCTERIGPIKLSLSTLSRLIFVKPRKEE